MTCAGNTKQYQVGDTNYRDALGLVWLSKRKSCLSFCGPDGSSVIVECGTWQTTALQAWLPACFCTYNLIGTQPCPFIYVLSMAAFLL